MSRLPSRQFVSSAVRQKIDARCAEFERAWAAGRSPRMEDFLGDFSEAARPYLLRALLAVEIEHRRLTAGGASLSENELLAAHPGLENDLRQAFQQLRVVGTKRVGDDERTIQVPAAAVDVEQTLARQPSHGDSDGLHIRCPHCRNPVELLDNTAYDSINCMSCGSMFSLVDSEQTMQAATPLQTIDRFEIVSRLGAGGFGTVWKARDRELDRIVAVKIPRKGQLGPADVEQFFREARAAAQLRHANIVPVHEVGRDGDTLFIVSDFVLGVDLAAWLSGQRPSPWEVAELCAPIADALHHAHQKGVVHRDLKPSNIMIDESGQPHLMDFGLAKREVGEITMTVDGQILGTPAYMSPEQAGGQSHWTDRRTDIYSLGVMMFEMLTGELPFRGNPQMQIYQRLQQDPPEPRTLNRHIPRDLATICWKCIEREPGRRYATAAELRDELRRFLNGEPILARPLSPPERVIRWTKRKPLVAAVAGLIIFLAIAGPSAALVIGRQRDRLAELLTERNNQIAQYALERQTDTNRITQLAQQLDVWEGRANPWRFWPPNTPAPPRQEMLGSLLEHSVQALGSKLENGDYGPNELASGYLGLAILADTKGRASEAIAYYEKACEQLAALQGEEPDDPRLSVALADCLLNLSRLLAEEDRAVAARHLERARAIYEKLASDYPSDATYKSAWLEAELTSAALAGFDSAAAHLQRVPAILRSLNSQWPTDPAGIYRLASFLADRQPVLLSREAVEPR